MESLESDSIGLLEHAGWVGGEREDVSDVVDVLRALEFKVSDAAIDFLSHFARLRVTHEPSIVLDGGKSCSHTTFDPTRVATSRDSRIARRCSKIIGLDICPVGTDGFHFTIYITPDYRFFAGRDASVFQYAETVNGLFRAMRSGIRPTYVGDWSLADG